MWDYSFCIIYVVIDSYEVQIITEKEGIFQQYQILIEKFFFSKFDQVITVVWI